MKGPMGGVLYAKFLPFYCKYWKEPAGLGLGPLRELPTPSPMEAHRVLERSRSGISVRLETYSPWIPIGILEFGELVWKGDYSGAELRTYPVAPYITTNKEEPVPFANDELETLRQRLYFIHPLSPAEKERATRVIQDIYDLGHRDGLTTGRQQGRDDILTGKVDPGSKAVTGGYGYVPEHEHQGGSNGYSGPVWR